MKELHAYGYALHPQLENAWVLTNNPDAVVYWNVVVTELNEETREWEPIITHEDIGLDDVDALVESLEQEHGLTPNWWPQK